MKRFGRAAMALCTALALLLCGCHASVPAEDSVLEVCLGQRAARLDPQAVQASCDIACVRLLYEGLTCPDGNGWVCGAAEDYTVSEDGLVYTYTLRSDALWSDGLPVVAQDFVYAWNCLLEPGRSAPFAVDAALVLDGGLDVLDGVAGAQLGVYATDDKTLEVHLSAPCAYMDALTALPALFPLRKDAEVSQGTLTNGAYAASGAAQDGVLQLAKSKTYWDGPSVRPDVLNLHLNLSDEAAASAVRAGTLDVSFAYPEDELDALTEEGLYTDAPLAAVYYVDFGSESAPFDDPLVRKAFALVAGNLSGKALPSGSTAADALIPPGVRDVAGNFYRAGTFAAQDAGTPVQQARTALAAAGYPNGARFGQVKMLFAQADLESGLAAALCGAWADALGIQVQPVFMDAQEILDHRAQGTHPAARAAYWNAFGDAQCFFDQDPSVQNLRLSCEALDLALGDAADARSEEARSEALHRAEAALMENHFLAPVLFMRQGFIARPGLSGVVLTPEGEWLLFGAQMGAAAQG